MFHRINRKKYKIKAFDIETHNDPETIEKGETSMWLGCYIDEDSKIDDEKSYIYTMDEFITHLEEDSTPKRHSRHESIPVKNICIYVYNLSFEWSFLLPHLLEHGFTFKEDIEKDDEYVFNSITTKSVSSVWSINLKFTKKSGIIIFRDLAKIYGGGLRAVAESFKLETQKGEIDYRLNRLHGHIVTKEEKEYCFKDTRILMEILMEMDKKDDKDFWNSMSMASYSMKKLIARGYPRSLKPYREFRKSYPELGEEETNFLRRGVEGGITYAPRDWQFKVINQKIGHIDAHQMHPSSAFLNLFPYGEGEYFTGEAPLGRICCCRVLISYDDVRLYSNIKLIGLPFVENFEIVVWDFEIPIMKKCYVNFRIKYIDGYAYKMRPLPWRRYYANNYYKRLEAKRNGDSFNVLFYKLLNNSSYGKLLEKPHNMIIENTIRDDGIIDSITTEKDSIKINARYTYLPVGSAIPAYSRVELITRAFELSPDGKKIVYFDTDSIFFIMDDETMKAWSKMNQEDFLGGWGWEEEIDRAQFTAPKRYKTETNGEATIKAGGINFNKYMNDNNIERLVFDEIDIVSSKWEVQRAYRCKGGTIIEFEEKEMKVQDKYIDIYNKNINN